ncbi:MAG: hypothetical protein JXB29_07650 [Sedimentisphaerales bacterium]|nr:hypothetical protein [Sedimentisphaerales bacterium]
MINLMQLTQQVRDEYENLLSIVVPTEQIRMTEHGQLFTGKNEFPTTREASEHFARLLKAPPRFYLTFEPDLRALFFNRRFPTLSADGVLGRDIRLTLNKERQIIGYDDPTLFKISPIKLMEIINTSLPQSLSAEQIEVSRLHISDTTLSLSCYSPQIGIEPRVGDIINGGVDVHHSTSGEFGTQIRVYLRRKICQNGACTHICDDRKHVRARRLSNGKFDENDMFNQIERLLIVAWRQINSKLEATRGLLNKKKVSAEFLNQQRTRFSLNNRILRLIEHAITQDEIGPTGTQYDFFNAISRVATHDNSLSLRQQRRLMFMGGEFSQQDVHKCPQCGNWIIGQN